MTFIGTPHVLAWLAKHPTMHRTVQQGQCIVCPHRQKLGHPSSKLLHRIVSMSHCPFCTDRLGKPIPITGEPKEYAWPLATS